MRWLASWRNVSPEPGKSTMSELLFMDVCYICWVMFDVDELDDFDGMTVCDTCYGQLVEAERQPFDP